MHALDLQTMEAPSAALEALTKGSYKSASRLDTVLVSWQRA